MIYLYTGTPGSGKSLHVARDIYWSLRRGKRVMANFGINLDLFKKKDLPYIRGGLFKEYDMYAMTPKFLMDFARWQFKRNKKGRIIEGQCILVIDECQMIFDCRDWQAVDRREWAKFFTQHRKFGYKIVLITQFDRLIDRKIRAVVEYEVVHRKLNNYNLFGLFLGLIGGGSAFISITRWYGARLKVGSEIFWGKKKYYEFYDSYQIF